MLRAVIKYARLINHVRQMLGMARREPVVTATLDEEQFVERIPIGQPGGAFLIGTEQVAR